MKKFLIEDVKVGVSIGGMACGPVPGNVIAEVCLRDVEEGTVKYHSLAEVEGTLNFFETDISTYDRQIENDPDEGFWDMLSEHSSGGFSDYYSFFENLEELKLHDDDHLLVWKYLVYMVRAEWEEVEQMKTESIGKCLGAFEIPVCVEEQDYLDEQDEEDTDETAAADEEELLENVRDDYEGLQVDTRSMELEEGESPAAWYKSEDFFRDGENEYRLTYGFDLNDDGEFTGIDQPVCERKVGETFVPCNEGEVSAERIYQELRDALDSWL